MTSEYIWVCLGSTVVVPVLGHMLQAVWWTRRGMVVGHSTSMRERALEGDGGSSSTPVGEGCVVSQCNDCSLEVGCFCGACSSPVDAWYADE